MRPKKPRFVDGVQLEDNLYHRGSGVYYYVKPDGKRKEFRAETPTEANALAKQANARRGSYRKGDLAALIEDHIADSERRDPTLKAKRSWENRCYAMRNFPAEVGVDLPQLGPLHIGEWWDKLSAHQQKLRHAEFRRLFNYLMARGRAPKFEYNPFTTNDDRPRLLFDRTPDRARERLTIDEFWRIHAAAGELRLPGVQLAMELSLATFLRRGDLVALTWADNVTPEALRCVVSKSEAKRGRTKAARLAWPLAANPTVKEILRRARELAFANGACPFVLSQASRRRLRTDRKSHWAQILPEQISRGFEEARIAAGIHLDLPKGRKPASFHEVRSLADQAASHAGHDIETIQHAMAHSDKSQSLLYLANHELPFEEVKVRFTWAQLGRPGYGEK